MPDFRYIDALMQPKTTRCAYPGCMHEGEYKAPLSPSQPNQFQWFCLDHVKEFNKKWDFFRNKSQEEIESFQKDAFTGHRPTWKMHPGGRQYTAQDVRNAFNRFMDDETIAAEYVAPIDKKDKQALSVLDLNHPVDASEIKRRFKQLVKQYHPDCNQGSKKAEERFKQITIAYRHLIDHYCKTISNP